MPDAAWQRCPLHTTAFLLFSCFSAITCGASPSRFICDPMALFTCLWRFSGDTFKKQLQHLYPVSLLFLCPWCLLWWRLCCSVLMGIKVYLSRLHLPKRQFQWPEFSAFGGGDVSTLLTAFLMKVMPCPIGCKLFSFPRISCADGCT